MERMTRRTCLLALLATGVPAFAQPDLMRLLKGVEDRYNRPRTIQIEFEQSLAGYGQGVRRESGTVYLRKPGRMRWDYKRPAGKFFLIDGKNVYFFSPNTRRVEKSAVKETDDMRVPLAFLIGRLDFQRDFREFRTRPEEAGMHMVAKPKSSRAPYSAVEFLIAKDHRIVSLKVIGQDESVMSFAFSNEQINPRLDDSVFTFRAPEGVEVVEVEGG